MRKTLLAVGLAVLVSMMLAPHGGRQGIVGWGPFFSEAGLEVSSNGIRFDDTGRVMIDMLALEIVFLAVLFALVVNIRWRRPGEKNRKPPYDLNSFAAAAPGSSPPSAPPRSPPIAPRGSGAVAASF